MYLLLCIALLGSAASVPYKGLTTDDYNKNDGLSALYVLPGESFPTFYDVQLFLDPDNEEYFNGKVAIRVLPYGPTDQLVLHAMEMTINNVTVTNDLNNVNIFDSFTIASDDTQLLKIKLNTAISAMQPHTITIDYTGQYAQNMFGIYVSTYESTGQGTEKVITSQLQPTFARRAFPCYDEPALKAVFRTTIYAPPAYPVVRSNMPERSDQLKPNVPGYLKHEFEDTLVMSPYLLAYLVSKFLSIENDSNPQYHVPFKVFSRPGTQTTAEFALDFGQKNMKALDEYTELPYAFPKIDKAAVPDFAAGAMENWGLVIYREAALLVQDGVTTTKMKQSIAKIICHENTHMWFGNEVSPQSWTYTWLNEGFANFFENFGTDLVLPEYRMMDQFVFLMQNVMQSDAVLGVNPMTHPVFTPSQILGTFNAVAYQKSGSVIRMLQNFLTPEVFRQGLVKYLKANSRKAAVPSDLYTALQQALDESNHTIPYSIGAVLTGWSSQGGFPVLTVRRAAPTAESVVVSQERYLTDPTQSSPERWHVPINWVLSTDPDFSNTSPQAWVPWAFPAQSYYIPGLSQTEWFIFNKQQTGYYRVNYDPENWAAISKVLNSSHETIHVLNRAQILDDSFNLARNGRLNYEYPLEISSYLLKEKDYIPWESANAAFEYLNNVLSGSEVYELFQQHLLKLTEPLFEELGFMEKTNEEVVTAFHRNIILDINCRHGNPICIETAQELLEQFRNNPTQSMNPDIQTVVFCSGLRGGDVDNFNFLWDRYLASDDSGEQSILLSALGCTSNEEMRTFYLNQVIDDNSPVREQDKSSIITAVTNASPENAQAALDFVIENFAEIQPRVQGLTGTTNILNTFASRLNTQAHNEKLDEFVSRYQSIFTAGEQAAVGAIRENIAASITWNQQNLATVVSWIQDNYGNGVSALTSSLLVFISIFVAVFNY